MGDRTQLERVMELEDAVRGLEARFNGITALVGVLVSLRDELERNKVKVAERMAKARAGRGKKKSNKRG